MVSVVIFLLYVSLGGMWAVTWTDCIQGMMMFVLTLLPLPIIITDMDVGGTLSGAMANDPAFATTTAPYLMMLGVGLFTALEIGTWWKRANAPGTIAAMLVGAISYTAMYLGGVMSVQQSEVLVTIPLGIITLIVVSLATRRPTGEEFEQALEFHRSGDMMTTVVSDD